MDKESGITVIDLFCGAGGFSEGFHQAGFDVVFGIDNWKPACETHMINGLGDTENIDLLTISIDDIVLLKSSLEKKYGTIDVIIGSPPCTEFSFAKHGGQGDIQKGMILVRKFLTFVAIFKPKYWLMENVPRLESVLNMECHGSKNVGWTISYNKLGITKKIRDKLNIVDKKLTIPYGYTFTSSDFGACQKRKRFIAGNYPFEMIDTVKINNKDVSLGGLIKRLENSIKDSESTGYIVDPNYPSHSIEREHLRDYFCDTRVHPMHWEHMRHLKRRSIQYGKMDLPDNLEQPSRTIMATYNLSSRESLLFETNEKMKYHGKERIIYRQPKIREIACIQGFPIDFQLSTQYLNSRYRLIGNAVPCQLSHAMAKTIIYKIENDNSVINDKEFAIRVNTTLNRFKLNNYQPIISKPNNILDEAIDFRKDNENLSKFKSDNTRHLRRKLLSSKLEKDSFMVIFENTCHLDGSTIGGNQWKVCIQKGIGKRYYQIFLDERSVSNILFSLSRRLDTNVIKLLLTDLINMVDNGIPELSEKWKEFPGWSKCKKADTSYLTGRTLKLPSVKKLQEIFTNDIVDIGGYVSPIDIFDCIDAALLSTYKKNELCDLWKLKIYVDLLEDNNSYKHRNDPRITSRLRKVEIPFITLISCIASVHILYLMYCQDEINELTGYASSLKMADEMIKKWCSSQSYDNDIINATKYLSL